MEALDLGKGLLVVINTGLMDDHQQELARAMEEQVRKRVGIHVERDFRQKKGRSRSETVTFLKEI